jgi:hypothetical protein
MKALFAFGILAIILALSTDTPTIEDKVAEQIEESQKLYDSATVELNRMRKINDSLLELRFGK